MLHHSLQLFSVPICIIEASCPHHYTCYTIHCSCFLSPYALLKLPVFITLHATACTTAVFCPICIIVASCPHHYTCYTIHRSCVLSPYALLKLPVLITIHATPFTAAVFCPHLYYCSFLSSSLYMLQHAPQLCSAPICFTQACQLGKLKKDENYSPMPLSEPSTHVP